MSQVVTKLPFKVADLSLAPWGRKEIEMAEKRGVHPREFVVAYDGVAVIVNHNNPIDRLSIEDLPGSARTEDKGSES